MYHILTDADKHTPDEDQQSLKHLLEVTKELEEKFETTFSDLISNEDLQLTLSQNIKKLAKPNATKDIVEEIIKLIK
jgi:UDP-N-acetylglucosamine:LPS N-acetylglucosamine transferase